MERTLDLSGVEVRDIEIAEAEFPNAVTFRLEGVLTDLDEDEMEAVVGKEVRPKSIVVEEVDG
ncbi:MULTISPECIES: hypothetical protein [Halorussus]|uniref:hypothetical protein n=1 Tax=Halorussus TaxID=1070314 RepID=UPI00209C714C|nr:hypothetical protein [Halorussus vallis]USZ76639.1 hypothetical protein NGM07_04760 [Halorussus vallis]